MSAEVDLIAKEENPVDSTKLKSRNDSLLSENDEFYLLGENNRLLKRSHEYESHHQQIRDLRKQLEELEGRLATGEKDKVELLAHMDHMNGQLSQAQKLIEEQYYEREQEREEFLAEISRLQKCLKENLSSNASSVTAYTVSVGVQTYMEPVERVPACSETEPEMWKTQQEAQLAMKKIEELEKVNTEYKCNFEAVKLEKEAEKENVERLVYELDERNCELERTRQEILEAGENMLQLKSLNESLMSEKQALKPQLQESMLQNSRLQRKLEELVCCRQKQKEAEQRVENVETENASLKEEVQQKVHQVQDLSNRLGTAETELRARRTEINHLRNSLNEINAESKEELLLLLSQKNEEISQFKETLERMEARMAAVKDVQKAYEAQKSAVEQASLRIQDKNKAYEELKRKHEELEQVLDETLREKESLSAKVLKFEEYGHNLETDFAIFKENAEAQYLDVCRKYDETIERLHLQLEKLTDYAGKSKVEASDSKLDLSYVWDLLCPELRAVLENLKKESQEIAQVVLQLQNQSIADLKSSSLVHFDVGKKHGLSIGEGIDEESLEPVKNTVIARIDTAIDTITACLLEHYQEQTEENLDSEEQLHTLFAAVSDLFKTVQRYFLKMCGSDSADCTKVDVDKFSDDIKRFKGDVVLLLSSAGNRRSNHQPSTPTRIDGDIEFENQKLRKRVKHLSEYIEQIKVNNQGLNEAMNAEREKTLAEAQLKVDNVMEKLRLTEIKIKDIAEEKERLEIIVDREKDRFNELKRQNTEIENRLIDTETALAEEKEKNDDIVKQWNDYCETTELLHVAATETIRELQEALKKEQERNGSLVKENTDLVVLLETGKRKLIDERTDLEMLKKSEQVVHLRALRERELEINELHSNVGKLKNQIVSAERGRQRLESHRRALIFQKQYLQEYVIASYQATERKAKLMMAEVLPAEFGASYTPALSRSNRNAMSGLRRFRFVGLVLVALWRMRKIARKWNKLLPATSRRMLSPCRSSNYREIPCTWPVRESSNGVECTGERLLDPLPVRYSSPVP